MVKAENHERARAMVAVSEILSGEEHSWLAGHLASCAACREFAETSQEAIRALRGVSVTAGGGLVSATQVRVRERAAELRRQQERIWVICACCAAVALGSALSGAALWPGIAWAPHWMEQQMMSWQAGLPAPAWEIGLLLLSWMPAVLAGFLLLARGTHFADSNDLFQ